MTMLDSDAAHADPGAAAGGGDGHGRVGPRLLRRTATCRRCVALVRLVRRQPDAAVRKCRAQSRRRADRTSAGKTTVDAVDLGRRAPTPSTTPGDAAATDAGRRRRRPALPISHRRHPAGRPADGRSCWRWSRSSRSLVAIYSIGYMHGDPGYWRFFAYIGLFVFSMTMLVSVEQFRAAVRVLGSGRPVQLPADRLLVSKSPRRRRPARRRFWSIASATSASPWACF